MSKRFLIPAMMLLSTFFLTGCLKVVITVNEDGSGTYSLATTWSPDRLDFINESDEDMEAADSATDMISSAEILAQLEVKPHVDTASGFSLGTSRTYEDGAIWYL